MRDYIFTKIESASSEVDENLFANALSFTKFKTRMQAHYELLCYPQNCCKPQLNKILNKNRAQDC